MRERQTEKAGNLTLTGDAALQKITEWSRTVYSEKGNPVERDAFLASLTRFDQRIKDKQGRFLTPIEEGWNRWIAGERPPSEGKKTS